MPEVSDQSFNFSPEFQDLILSCIVKEHQEFGFLTINLSARHFTGLQASVIAKVMLEYIGIYTTPPSFPMLYELSRSEAVRHGMDKTQLSDYVKKLEDMDTTRHWRKVKDKVANFIKEREIIATHRRSLESMREGTPFDYVTEFTKAVNVCNDLNEMGLLFDPTDTAKTIRKVTSRGYGVRCGYPLIDNHFPWGFMPGELIVPLAPPKSCKTTLCLNFAFNMVSPAVDVDVLYYTCEISQEIALLRQACRLARLPLASIFQNPDLFIEQFNQAFATIGFRSRLLFKGFASNTATISDIQNHALAIKAMGLEPKAIFIDYAERVKYSKPVGEAKDHRLSANIFSEARAFGTNLECPVFMPERCNAETVSKAVPNMTSFQGSFEKGGIVDYAFGICMTEQEKLNNIFRLFFFLARNQKSMQYFRGTLDLETYRMEVNEEIEYAPDPDDHVAVRARQSRTRNSGDHALPTELQE